MEARTFGRGAPAEVGIRNGGTPAAGVAFGLGAGRQGPEGVAAGVALGFGLGRAGSAWGVAFGFGLGRSTATGAAALGRGGSSGSRFTSPRGIQTGRTLMSRSFSHLLDSLANMNPRQSAS